MNVALSLIIKFCKIRFNYYIIFLLLESIICPIIFIHLQEFYVILRYKIFQFLLSLMLMFCCEMFHCIGKKTQFHLQNNPIMLFLFNANKCFLLHRSP